MSSRELEQQIYALREENQALRAELARIEERARAGKAAKGQVVRIGWRVLVPLLDRQKVVRSFARLTNTASGFAGPQSAWPTREALLTDARTFAESCVRFVVRRRLFLLIFSLIAATIPALQLYLVVQQNEIIRNQNEFVEIEVYDALAQALNNDNRRAKEMVGGLLGNAKIEFMQGAVNEVFDPELAFLTLEREEADEADERRLDDAGYRGYLIRAAARSVYLRASDSDDETKIDDDELYRLARPMFETIVKDAVDRVPEVLRAGDQEGFDLEDEPVKEAAYYLYQVGYLLRIYARLARAVGEEKRFFENTRELFKRLAGARMTARNRFAFAHRVTLENFLLDLAQKPALDAPTAGLDLGGKNPEEVLRAGVDRLRKAIGDDALNWKQLEAQVGL